MAIRITQEILQKFSAQQIQVMGLLSLPCALLEEKIKQEIEENPALEEISNTEPLDINEENTEDEVAALDEYTPDLADYEEFFDQEVYYNKEHITSDYKAHPVSLYENLLEQLRFELETLEEICIAEQIIGNLDENGYLVRELSAITDDLLFYQNINISLDTAQKVLKILQHIEPIGFGAKNLQECLLLQLKVLPHQTHVAAAIELLSQDFDLFVAQKFSKIQQKRNISTKNWAEIIKIITTLHPKPAHLLEEFTLSAQTVIPDFIVQINEKNELEWAMNQGFMPNIGLNTQFQALKSKTKVAGDLKFIQKQLQTAKNFIQALELRKNILQITFHWLVNWQKEYFLSGEEYLLKPLILKDVAQALQIDISTVSRVVNQKYVQTRFGIIPLKKLFSDKINTQGESVSPFYVKERIKNVLEQQSLTDEQLTKILVQEGIQIARRTVNKYRQEIHLIKI